jgi:hypothetical protein
VNAVTEFSVDIFLPYVGSTFDLVGNDGRRVPTVLERVADRGRDSHSTTFSLYFVVPEPAGPNMQGTYHLECEGLGAVDLFLVPIGREGDALRFEATMNLLLPSEGK